MISWPHPHAHITSTAIPAEPTSVNEASKFPEWRKAMQLEFDALLSNKTWTLVLPATSQNLVGCRWIFKTKYISDGTIESRKAHLVAKGYSQLEGLDYSETFSPVVKPTSIRLVFSVAISSG
ncbi:uncharacterized mitochondrial protein AtMg00820-like [Carya illinoinensis]|uniref:uncharacterized mitochondrial protein AtMg00820-like n=1 Tax=Carya illinoinensis TaxID=32201 RepID=UPI001C71F334|nr:uncharacterized mitochondrial protein AtMg00820-like [Carya illinoinensis]